jgi:dipeptidyl aminopeptidase/acylaminoacyl peptidase
MSRRGILIIVIVVVVLLVVGYSVAGAVIYNTLSDVSRMCAARESSNTPSAFTVEDIDTTTLAMENYEDVSFPSRDPNITISAWYVPAEDEANAPAVILVHGLRGCKYGAEVLLPAGMLHRAGFNVLLMDMRDHGDSTIEDRRYAGGTEEYRDVLGAWDWLMAEKGIPAERIGLFGVSLGAATVMIATGEEPRVAAVWEDSGFADINVAIVAELSRNGYPTFLASSASLMSQVISGDNITAFSPLNAMAKLNGRPIYITHGDADTRLSVQYASDLAEAVRTAGGQVEPWIIAGSGHVQGMFNETEEYERRLSAFFSEALGQA